jgi:hypothetical protein
MSAVDITLKVLGYALFPYSGILETITDGLQRSAQQTNDVAASGDIEKMEAIEMRQELEMRMAERQAKVAQELAIAQRIRTAEEVEVEEFYDYSGEGNLGLNAKDGGVMLGIGGKGSRVVKRICRFKGVREITPQEIQVLAEQMAGNEAPKNGI